MKKYLFTIIPFILGVVCFVSYIIIGSEIAPDGTLVEPFGLIPIGFLLIAISIIVSSIMSTWALFHNPTKIDKVAFGVSIALILLSASYLFLVFSYFNSLDMKDISMVTRNIIC
ncbi:DUF3955 domain-containing protein [Paraclostridium bifermentans]|uniref:DUF3955 domain-containing protein n=1 Tax=Paraclostridium bifermentans TaxID=1490 RepID=A0ABY8R2J7_PARBF|nr:DUF3955 domain-containing protein [Paraclostridium bifermentans]